MTHVRELRITGNEDPRDIATAMPGEFDPNAYVHVRVWNNGRGITVTASYAPIGHGMARVASSQKMDAAARAVDPSARFSGVDRSPSTYGAFGWGSRVREYGVTPDGPMPAWVGDAIPGDTGEARPLTGPFAY